MAEPQDVRGSGSTLKKHVFDDGTVKYYWSSPATQSNNTSAGMGAGAAAGSNSGRKKTPYAAASVNSAPQPSYADQMRAIQQQAYDRNMAALSAAYQQRAQLLEQQLTSQLGELQRNYDFSAGQVNQDASRSLQSAYVNMMLNRRDLPQMLAAQGISGGMSESTLAGIRNNYGGTRNEVESSRANAIARLLNTLQNNQGAARRSYTEQLAADSMAQAQAKVQMEQQLANALASIAANG